MADPRLASGAGDRLLGFLNAFPVAAFLGGGQPAAADAAVPTGLWPGENRKSGSGKPIQSG